MFSSIQSFLLHIKAVGKREEAHSRIFMQTQKPAEHASGLSVDAKNIYIYGNVDKVTEVYLAAVLAVTPFFRFNAQGKTSQLKRTKNFQNT